YVVSARGLESVEARLHDLVQEEVAPRLIALAQVGVVRVWEVQRGDGGLLQQVGRPYRNEVVRAADADGQLRVGDGVADAPTRDRVGLRDPGDGDGALGHARQRGDGNVLSAVVDDVLVDLVGDGEQVVAEGQIGDLLQLRRREDLAGGVVGAVEDDGPRARGDRLPQPIRVEGERGRLEGDPDGLGARDDAARAVVLVEGLEDDHLVARIEEGQERREHR